MIWLKLTFSSFPSLSLYSIQPFLSNICHKNTIFCMSLYTEHYYNKKILIHRYTLQPSVCFLWPKQQVHLYEVHGIANSQISHADGTLPAALLLHHPRHPPLHIPPAPPFTKRAQSRQLGRRAARHRNPPQPRHGVLGRCPPSHSLTSLSDSPLHLPALHSVSRQRN